MEKKKIIKIIFYIVLLLALVGCAVASCKKTNAYFEVNTDNSDNYEGYALFFDVSIANGSGQECNLAIGNDLYDEPGYANDDYLFYSFKSLTTGYVDFMLNFYGYDNKTYLQIYALDNNQVYAAETEYVDSVGGGSLVLVVLFQPGTSSVKLGVCSLNFDTTTNKMSLIAWDTINIPMSSNYTDVSIEQSATYNYYTFEYTDTPYNLMFYLDDINNSWDIVSICYAYNTFLNNEYRAFTITGLVGYQAGYQAGTEATTQEAYENGYLDGVANGYNEGYSDGANGSTAITPVFALISGIFSSLGSILAVELVPHVPLGLFILVPLFFAVVGLVLWIWRKNG